MKSQWELDRQAFAEGLAAALGVLAGEHRDRLTRLRFINKFGDDSVLQDVTGAEWDQAVTALMSSPEIREGVRNLGGVNITIDPPGADGTTGSFTISPPDDEADATDDDDDVPAAPASVHYHVREMTVNQYAAPKPSAMEIVRDASGKITGTRPGSAAENAEQELNQALTDSLTSGFVDSKRIASLQQKTQEK